MPTVEPLVIYDQTHNLSNLDGFVESAFSEFGASVAGQIGNCKRIRGTPSCGALPHSKFLPDETHMTKLADTIEGWKEQADEWTARMSKKLGDENTGIQQVECAATETIKAFDFAWQLMIAEFLPEGSATSRTASLPRRYVTKTFKIKLDPDDISKWSTDNREDDERTLLSS